MEQFTNNRIVQIDFDASIASSLSGMNRQLILTSTENCYIRINKDDVSASNGFYIPKESPTIINVTKVDKIVAIKEVTAGKLTIMELF